MPSAEHRPASEKRRAASRRPTAVARGAETTDPTRADALGRIAAKVSGRRDLTGLFDDIIDEAFVLFGVDRAALWTYDPTAEHPLELAAQRGLPPVIIDAVNSLPKDARTAGMDAIRRRRVRVLDRDMRSTTHALREVYKAIGVGSVCFVPLVYGGDALGLLVLYHREAYGWTPAERALARAFGDHMATAIGTARLADSRRGLADRLSSIAELAGRLSGLHDRASIAAAIVEEAKRLIEHDTIRVYHVDHPTGMCEPIAFEGTFLGTTQPDMEALRMPIGQGLTGWVAANGRPLRLRDATRDPRSVILGDRRPESMLLVPMVQDDVVRGVIVVSAMGIDRFDADDEVTLTIFAAAAVQAVINAENLDRLRRQQAEMELQLEGQRRLLEVNERLLGTLDPAGVLELIADSLRAIVPYDSLTIYQVDREAGVRRAVIARDRFADEILADESPLGPGITGWVIDHREAVLANDAHLDARSVQVPNTPFEPESIMVVPLLVSGETIGTLNIGRLGESDAHFTTNEFELTKLFAGQASIAMQNAQTHREVRVRAEQDALTGLRNHGAFQRELGAAVEAGRPFAVLMLDLDAFKRFNDTLGHPAGDGLLVEIAAAMTSATRETDRVYRYGGDEFATILPGADRVVAHEVAERIRRAVRDRTSVEGATDRDPRPSVTISAGVACYPEDGRTKDELVAVADRALYMVKGDSRRQPEPTVADPYVRALDETALALLDRTDPNAMLSTILDRASSVLGTPHGWVDLVESDANRLVLRVGLGMLAGQEEGSIALDEGVGGEVVRTGQPFAVADYDAWPGRSVTVAAGWQLGATIAAPLKSAGRVIGVLGLAAGATARTWSERDLETLSSFARLAAIGLENARLVDVAQRGALYDPTTGLPNRELLADRIAHSLAGHGTDADGSIGVILLDLDRFKVVNETLGHVAGDRLLMAVGQRLVNSLRPGDTVARFGGDEFALVLDPVANAAEAHHIAERIAQELHEPFPLNGRDWFLTASIGIALAAPGRGSPDDLLREAEIAMVRAKGNAGQRHFLFEPSMSDQTLERLDLENDLRRALDRDELRVHYQPIVSLVSGAVAGFEALVRWQHPTRGLVPPLAFIPMAEETGLIVPLGRWVLDAACRQATVWNATRTGKGTPPLFVSVNLSARQFTQTDLVEDVRQTLAHTGLEADALELEITESVLMDQSEAGIRALRDLRGLGVRLVLDDFGTGYSSLSYLKHLPLDTIKIDRTFVAGIEETADRSIVDAVIALAHGLGIGVVAEGIETDEQADRLRELGCDLGQGYLFSRPVPAEQTAGLLGSLPTARAATAPRATARRTRTRTLRRVV
jgi:diguanylate cyclase (GGDEF)-like protein